MSKYDSEALRWFVLSNTEGTILAVYGAALESMANERAQAIADDTRCAVALHDTIGNRPAVYGSITMAGSHKMFGPR